MKRRITVLAAVALSVSSVAVGVFARDIIDTIEAQIRPDFTIAVDGKVQSFKNANGETVYPLLYEGTTYLPVRAIGELMGKTVYWYENDKRIELNTVTSTVTDADVIITGDTKPQTGTTTGNNTSSAGEITSEQAKNIALDKAGLTENDVVLQKVQLEYDDGRKVYDVEFMKDAYKYSAEILVSDGTVISWEEDDKNIYQNQTGEITIDEAKKIALNKAGLTESQVTFIKAELDFDDGQKIYDIEFIKDMEKYSAEILVSDGRVVSWEEDRR